MQANRLTNHQKIVRLVVCAMLTALGVVLGGLLSIPAMPFGSYTLKIGFGVLPVIYEMAASLGIDPVQIGCAAVLGQMTVGFPISPLAAATLVLISVSRVNLIDHQKFMFFWAFGTTLIMTVVCYLTGALTF